MSSSPSMSSVTYNYNVIMRPDVRTLINKDTEGNLALHAFIKNVAPRYLLTHDACTVDVAHLYLIRKA